MLNQAAHHVPPHMLAGTVLWTRATPAVLSAPQAAKGHMTLEEYCLMLIAPDTVNSQGSANSLRKRYQER